MPDTTAFDIDPSAILAEGEETQEENQESTDEGAQDDAEVDAGSESESEGAESSDEDKSDEDKSEDEDEKGEKGGKSDDDIDLRKAAKEIRESLNKLREIDPKAAKALRTALGHDLAYQETFKTPQEARVFKAAVDAVGGTEALVTMQEQLAYSQEIDALSEAGDPKVLETFAKDFPDGFKKLMPHYLDSVKKMDAQAYASAIQPHLIDNLEAAGVGNVLTALKEAADKGDADAVKKIAENLASWYGGQKTTAARLRTEAVNPAADALSERERALNEREAKAFEAQWKEPVGQHASSQIYKVGEPYIRNVPIGQQRAFFQEVIREIDRRITADKTYSAQETALMKAKNRDVNKIIAFKNAKVDTLVSPSIEKVAKEFGFKIGAKPAAKVAAKAPAAKTSSAPAVGAGSSPSNPIYLKDKPSTEDRDMSIKDAVDWQIAGKAMMKSGPYKGKWVTWRPKK